MMDELVTDLALAVEDRHLQRIEGQVGAQVVSDLPSDDLAGEQVRDERGVCEPAGRACIGDVRDPVPPENRIRQVTLQSLPGGRLRAHIR
jgi:hypothetical protein